MDITTVLVILLVVCIVWLFWVAVVFAFAEILARTIGERLDTPPAKEEVDEDSELGNDR